MRMMMNISVVAAITISIAAEITATAHSGVGAEIQSTTIPLSGSDPTLFQQVLQPTQQFLQHTQEDLQSTQQILQPTQQILQPAQQVLQPTQQVLQPTQQILQPAQQVLQPAHQILQPAQQVFQPAHQIAQPAQQVIQVASEPPIAPSEGSFTVPTSVQPSATSAQIVHTLQPRYVLLKMKKVKNIQPLQPQVLYLRTKQPKQTVFTSTPVELPATRKNAAMRCVVVTHEVDMKEVEGSPGKYLLHQTQSIKCAPVI